MHLKLEDENKFLLDFPLLSPLFVAHLLGHSFILFYFIQSRRHYWNLKWTKWENLNKFLCKFYRFSSNFSLSLAHSSSIHTQIEKYHLGWRLTWLFVTLRCARCYFPFYHIKRVITINRLSWSLKHEIASLASFELFELTTTTLGIKRKQKQNLLASRSLFV